MSLKFKVRVPATSANIGVGYDCLGLALDYLLELEVEENDKIEFLENGEPFSIPIEDNYIFEAIKYTEKHLVKNILHHYTLFYICPRFQRVCGCFKNS